MNRAIPLLGALKHRRARSQGEHSSAMAQTELRNGKDTQMRRTAQDIIA
jgi:hypothetical protein